MSKRKPRMKGVRTAYLKRFHGEYINAGKKANSAYLQEAFARVKSIERGEINTTNYENMSNDMYEKWRLSEIAKMDARDVVLKKLCWFDKDGNATSMWQTAFWQGKETFHRINVLLTNGRNLFLFFSGERFFFVREVWNYNEEEMRKGGIYDGFNKPQGYRSIARSIVYPNRQIAWMAYHSQTICWVEPRDMGFALLDGGRPPRLTMENFKKK